MHCEVTCIFEKNSLRSCLRIRVKKENQAYQNGQWQVVQPEDTLKLTQHEAQVIFHIQPSRYLIDLLCCLLTSSILACALLLLQPHCKRGRVFNLAS
jgi:hypothetical protein